MEALLECVTPGIIVKTDVINSLEEPPDKSFGDLASTLPFTLAKKLKKPPLKIAQEIVSELKKIDQVKKIKILGNGYINFFIDYPKYSKETLNLVLSLLEKYGNANFFEGKKVIIEYPAVNPSKPWHIGHARNAILGDTMSRILNAVGFNNVLRIDYINDLGLQIAQLYFILKQKEKWNYTGKYDHFLGKAYVKAVKQIEGNKQKEEEVREILKLMEEGDNETSEKIKKIAFKCVRAQYETAYRLNIFHDLIVWESDIVHSGLFKKALERMLECEHIERLESGAIIAKIDIFDEFKEMKEPYKVLVRPDGTATYLAADIAFQMWKFGKIEDVLRYRILEQNENTLWTTSQEGKEKKFNGADYVINVIGAEQAFPQRLMYLSLKLMGFEKEYKNSYHLAYEHVWLPETKFRGREGTWIGYTTDDMINEAIERARLEVEKKNPNLDLDTKIQISEAVGIGAIRYSMIKSAPEKKITFRWDEVLDFNGDAAPYIQYAHARSCRILEKSKLDPLEIIKDANFELIKTENEKDLVLLISKFPSLVLNIIKRMKQTPWGTKIDINLLPAYAYKLATAFNQFYTNCPVLSSEEEIKIMRVILVKATQQTLNNVLNLMGITALERM